MFKSFAYTINRARKATMYVLNSNLPKSYLKECNSYKIITVLNYDASIPLYK